MTSFVPHRFGRPAPLTWCVLAALGALGPLPVSEAQCGRWLTSNAQTAPIGMGLGGATVNAIARLPNGDFIIAGTFTTAGGGPANNIVRYTGSSYYSILGSGLDNTVNGLAVTPGGDLIAVGAFNNAGGVPASRIARWNGTAWSAVALGIVGNVTSVLVLPNGEIVIGGTFTDAGGNPDADRIARWDGTAWQAYGPGLGNTVRALARLSNGDIIAVGDFTNAGGNGDADRIARWNGTAWQSFGTGLGAAVYSVSVLPSGDLVAGGDFVNAGGNADADRIAQWNGSAWQPLGTGLSGGVGTPSARALLQLPGGDLLVGGSFSSASGVAVTNVARWNGSAWSSFGSSGPNATVQVLAQATPADVFVGGSFTNAGGVSTRGIAISDGVSWKPLGGGFAENVTPEVHAIAVASDGDIVVGGNFTGANNAPASRIARLDAQAWTPLGQGLNNIVYSLLFEPNGDLIAGGGFSFSGPLETYGVSRWNGSVWNAMGTGSSLGPVGPTVRAMVRETAGTIMLGGNFNSMFPFGITRWTGSSFQWNEDVPNGFVYALLRTSSGQIIAGGSFTDAPVSPGPVRRLATYTGPGWAPLGGGIGTAISGDVVYALAEMPNGDIVVGGRFTVAGGGPGNSIARWNGASWSQFGTGMSGGSPITIVFALAVMPNGDLVAAGNFTTADGNTVNGIARWNGVTWVSMGGGATCCLSPNSIYALTVHPNGELLAGGIFRAMGTTISTSLARWTEDGVPLIDQQPASQTANVGGFTGFTVVPTQGYDFEGPLMFQWRRNGVSLSDGATPAGTIIAGATTAVLSLSTIAAADAGQYSVTVTNGCGTVVSATATLTVNAPAPCPGDSNGDLIVNFADITEVLQNFGAMCQPNAPSCPGDSNGDLIVNFADITEVLQNFGAMCP